MFENLPAASPDAIFGLMEEMRADPRPEKLSLVAGVYQDEKGHTPIFEAVHRAEKRLLDTVTSKTYLPIDGAPAFITQARGRLSAAAPDVFEAGRTVTIQTLGGTGGLRVAGDFLRRFWPGSTLWLSDPTWPNHPQVFEESLGFRVAIYPYFDRQSHALDFAAMMESLGRVAPGDVVVLHGCCHNPTGTDPSPEQWAAIGDLLAERGALPLVDFAYQGFARGVVEDAEWLAILARRAPEMIVCASFSKNFGLYNERIGALTLIAREKTHGSSVAGWLKRSARANYSNPPAHGAALIAAVLTDAELRRSWETELAGMRRRIRTMRERFARGLDERGVALQPDGNDFIVQQNGMFSFSGLGKEEVARLRDEHAIYMMGTGRMNVAGMNEGNLERICDAVAAVRG